MYMNGYQPYGVNPYGAAPQMQERLMQMEQQKYGMQIPQYTIGNIVSGMEEAKMREIIPNGTSYFFPSPSENRIYEKSTDLNGQQIFKAYELVELPNVVPATTGSVKALEERVKSIEDLLRELIGGNENAQSNAANGNGHAISEPNGSTTADGRPKSAHGKNLANGSR